jgi:HEAT repeat protein
LARLVYSDDNFGLPNYDARVGAVGGFYILGEVAVAALPKLEEIMKDADGNLAVLALIAASNMGTNSVPVVIRAFTNRHADVRSQAISLFIDGPMQSFSEGRKQAIPEIRRLLADSDESVRVTAANALKEIEPKPVPRAGVK